MRAEEALITRMIERERLAAEERARELASLTPEQLEHRNEVARRRQREVRRAAERRAQDEADRLAVADQERAANNPLLPLPSVMAAPRQWRPIARVGVVNEQDEYVEEMIDVDARAWQLEGGERVEVITNFGSLPRDVTLRLAALAMEMTARQLEDDSLAHLMETA